MLFPPTGWLNWCTTQTSTDLPVCKTFSKPVLCSPSILAAPLVPCIIISGFRGKASAVDPTMEHHTAATSSDATDRRTEPLAACQLPGLMIKTEQKNTGKNLSPIRRESCLPLILPQHPVHLHLLLICIPPSQPP